MNKIIIFTLFFIFLFISNTFSSIIFEIGKKDGQSSEFALFPDKYDQYLSRFGGEKIFYVGYSEIHKDWSFILPGPLDSWAGGGYWAGFHPRHFPSILFNLEKQPTDGNCLFSLFFTGVNAVAPVKIRIEINGHRFEKEIIGEDTDEIIHNPNIRGTAKEVCVSFPATWLNMGLNTIQLGTIAGSWSLFDCIRMECSKEMHLQKNSTSTLIRSVEAASFEYKEKNNKLIQPLLVHIYQFGNTQQLTFKTEETGEIIRTIEPGESIQEILMPAIQPGKKGKNTLLSIYQSGQKIFETSVKRFPQPLHSYCDDVDLLMGTGNSRWMFKPASTLPLSMVQIAPDNQDEIWKAGYEYTIENIMGFNHISDWTMTGFLMMPTNGPLLVNPGREDFPDEGYRSRIDKKSEKAQIGKYSVYMTDTKIKAEVTSTRRAAMQRYIFPQSKDSRVIIDMFTPNEYLHNLLDTRISKVSDTEIEGYATYYNAFTGYSLEQNYTLYFVLQFSKPFQSMGGWINREVEQINNYQWLWKRSHQFDSKEIIYENINQIKGSGDAGVFVNFETFGNDSILVRSGISLVDMQGARNNLEQEITQPFGWNFEAIVNNSRNIWEKYLSRIEIETNDYLQKKKFYTNFYRALAAKAIWSDFDGRYRDEDENIRKLEKEDDCIISGEYWNTFWNLQPFFNLIVPEISQKWARSAIELYKNSGWFNTDPAGIEHTGVMVAMHLISQIQGAWNSGIRDFDLREAYPGLKKMLLTPPEKYPGGGTVGVENLVPYMQYGYIPQGKGTVSNTMEYAYDDWSLAQLAKTLGETDDYIYFMKRSCNWENLMDTVSGFIRPKDEAGNWIEPFDPYQTPGFTEGNAFNYTWFAPHNPERLIELMGRERFVSRLNEAMEKSSHANFNAAGDNFANYPINHGNETSMEVAYLFNWAKAPWLTQQWIRAIQEQYYGTTPYDAYPGDEDLGQMSSWYIMSAIGLFQMEGGCSENPFYELGSPRFPRITVHLDQQFNRGKTFIIEANNASKNAKYIHSVKLNGQPINSFRIPQSEVFKGGKMVLEMKDTPNYQWGIE